MKIFNWVHKRFHHTVLKDGFARSVKTTELTTNNTDKQALLKQVALADVLDGWRDGILTIGTLGLENPLKPFNQQNEYLILESEEEDEDHEDAEVGQYSVDDGDDNEENVDEHEELNPLMFTTFGHNFEDFESNPDHDNVHKPDVIMTVDGVSLTPYLGSPELNVELDNMEGSGEQKKKKGERITLADLFLADADVKEKLKPDQVYPNSGKKPVLRTKNGLSFAKKFIPRVKEDSTPIKNLQRLMKRMLKRKIHPEFEVKMHKSDGEKPGETGLIIDGEHGVSESDNLLPTQA
uniref:Protein TILLER ANGLE CONTROL 1 n=1 Tax=Fagus sylvatica TaxID=28930 RepID=A0A2N9IRQ4_FAGSY